MTKSISDQCTKLSQSKRLNIMPSKAIGIPSLCLYSMYKPPRLYDILNSLILEYLQVRT